MDPEEKENDGNKKTFSVVKFDSNDTLEIYYSVVATKWLNSNGTKCKWPKKDIRNAIKKALRPTAEWDTYGVHVMRSFDSYAPALLYEKKLTNLETDTSDVPQQLGRGQRKRKKKVFSDTDSCSSQDEDSLPDPPQPPSPFVKRNISKVVIGDKENYSPKEWNSVTMKFFDVSDNERIIGRHNFSTHSAGTFKKNKENSNSPVPPTSLHIPAEDEQDIFDVSEINEGNFEQEKEDFHVQETSYVTVDEPSNANILKSILETVVFTKMMLGKLVTKLERQNYNIITAEYDEVLLKLPLTSQDGLEDFNNLVTQNTNIKSDFLRMLVTIGGQDTKKCIKRTLEKVFSNSLACKCSWTGAKNNYALNKLLITDVIKSAVQTNFPQCTDSLYEETFKDWFRYAQQRLKRKDPPQRT